MYLLIFSLIELIKFDFATCRAGLLNQDLTIPMTLPIWKTPILISVTTVTQFVGSSGLRPTLSMYNKIQLPIIIFGNIFLLIDMCSAWHSDMFYDIRWSKISFLFGLLLVVIFTINNLYAYEIHIVYYILYFFQLFLWS